MSASVWSTESWRCAAISARSSDRTRLLRSSTSWRPMPQIHGPASSAAPPSATIIASSTLPRPSIDVRAPRKTAIPARISTAPIANRVADNGVPRVSRFHRPRSPSPRAQRTAKPMAPSTTGHARFPWNQRPASQRSARIPTMTRPIADGPARRRQPDPARRRLDPVSQGLERGEQPGQDVDDEPEAGGEGADDERDPHDARLHAEVVADAAGHAGDPSVAAAALEAGSPLTGVDLGHGRMFPQDHRRPRWGTTPRSRRPDSGSDGGLPQWSSASWRPIIRA